MRYGLSISAAALLLVFSLSSCDDKQWHHDKLDEVEQELHNLKSQQESQQHNVVSSGPTICLGEGQYPAVGPDGVRVQVYSKPNLIWLTSGWRYWGFLHDEAQGVLTDNTNGQRWYVYAQFGEPGSGKITWYAYPVPGKGEIMENSFNHSNLNNF
jgi:hypothetical protein